MVGEGGMWVMMRIEGRDYFDRFGRVRRKSSWGEKKNVKYPAAQLHPSRHRRSPTQGNREVIMFEQEGHEISDNHEIFV